MKRHNEQNLFLKAVKVSRVRQGGDGDHMTIYNWQGQRLAMNIDKRPFLRLQQAEIPVRLNLSKAARLGRALSQIKKAKSSQRLFQARPDLV
jgi:hypothetical protein